MTIGTGGRRVIGIVGPPGSGKSTLAARHAGQHGETCVVVPMDGFHLARRQLERLGRAQRKGAPDTFDVDRIVHPDESFWSGSGTPGRAEA